MVPHLLNVLPYFVFAGPFVLAVGFLQMRMEHISHGLYIDAGNVLDFKGV